MVKNNKSSRSALQTKDEKGVRIVATIIAIIFALVCLIPFLRVLSQALSSDKYVVSGRITVYPMGLTLKNIKFVLTYNSFTSSMRLSVIATIVFTACALIMTVFLAYPM